jgi:hypothetical protein
VRACAGAGRAPRGPQACHGPCRLLARPPPLALGPGGAARQTPCPAAEPPARLPSTCRPVPPLQPPRQYLDTVLLGFINAGGKVELNPEGARAVPADARLVLLGRNGEGRQARGASCGCSEEGHSLAMATGGRSYLPLRPRAHLPARPPPRPLWCRPQTTPSPRRAARCTRTQRRARRSGCRRSAPTRARCWRGPGGRGVQRGGSRAARALQRCHMASSSDRPATPCAPAPSQPRHIIVAGWPEEGVPELMAGFADLTHSGGRRRRGVAEAPTRSTRAEYLTHATILTPPARLLPAPQAAS